ncbi:hypothetical protein AURDEDRAFT_173116 [Auricularia subglabra TFB-10046 SS5]|nr:hypothetical protein AURDEDRAFT_173116 [Auricularia subglabra TFB-10046 SS5]
MIPAELLQAVFDYVSIDTLLSCAHVCCSWRELARGHPSYWRTLSISDETLTPTSAAFFVDRLNARAYPDSTVSLFLRCRVASPLMANIILPHVCANIHRAHEFSLIFTPASAELVIPMFFLPAPSLITLRVLVNGAVPTMPAVPALFQAHRSCALQTVLLFDVPVCTDISPITHTLKSLQLAYVRMPNLLPRVLSVLPHFRMLDPFTADTHFLPLLSELDTSHISSLSIYTPQWFLFPRISQVSTLLVRLRRPTTEALRRIAPAGSRLHACIMAQQSSFLPIPAISGQAALVGGDGSSVRYFEYLDIAYMASQPFLTAFLPSAKLVTLSISLDLVFQPLCQSKAFFPLLERLSFGINAFPACEQYDMWGRIDCPTLRDLTFQRESTSAVLLSKESLTRFVETTIRIDGSTPLRVIVGDVTVTDADCGSGIIGPIVHADLQPWFTSTPGDGSGETSAVESVLNLPKFGWMDLNISTTKVCGCTG